MKLKQLLTGINVEHVGLYQGDKEMGAYTSIRITRSAAKKYMMERLFNIQDSQLEDFMDAELNDRLYDCVIVNDEDENDDDLL